MLLKDQKFVSKKIRNFAKGQSCSIRIPGVCSGNPEQTVWCHASGGGMGAKQSDECGAFGCYPCHSVIDGHTKSDFSPMEVELFFWHGHAESLKTLRQNKLITLGA